MKTVLPILLLLTNMCSMCMELPLEFLTSDDIEQYDREREHKWWENLYSKAALKNMTPLSFACSVDIASDHSLTTIKKILSKTDDINQQDPKTLNTALHSCAEADLVSNISSRIALLLLERPGIDVNIKNKNGDSPLFIACAHNRALRYDVLVDLLLATQKIDFSLQNAKGQDIVQFVCQRYRKSYQKLRPNCSHDPFLKEMQLEYECRKNEWIMHKIMRATTKPMHCSLIMAVFSQEHSIKDACEPLVKDIVSKIAYLIYVLHNELIAARKYKKLDQQGHYYYGNNVSSPHAYRKQIKEKMMQSPTAEDIRLLWED